MILGTFPRIGLAIFCLAGTAPAQQQVRNPEFEVISIKVVPPNAPPFHFDSGYKSVLPGGHYRNDRTNLSSLIAFAYNQKIVSRVVGLPDWAKKTEYLIEAKAPGGPELPPEANREQVRLMVRSMLANRFNLKVHKEAHEERIYYLELAGDSFKFEPVGPPVPPDTEGRVNAAMGNDSGRVIAKKGTLPDFANMLSIMLRRPVIDRTGLQGYYDFDVRWNAPETAEPVAPGFGTEGEALLMSALREKLDLRLRAGTGPVEYVIVDHVDPPARN